MRKSSWLYVLALCVLPACGGGGGGSDVPTAPGSITTPVPVSPSSGGSPTPRSTATPSAHPSATTHPTPTPLPTMTLAPTPTPLPTPIATQSPPPGLTLFPSSWGLIAPFQVFDYFPSTGTAMTNAQIAADGYRYPAVWGSFNPAPWYASVPNVYTARYYLPEEDSNLISGNTLAWFQTNHPDWILYACDTNNNPTMLYAYSGTGFPDVPLDMHNSAVVDYQIRQSLAPYLIANHYRAAALDQIVFANIMKGGNPQFGQKVMPGYYGCGVYQNGTFVRRYASRTDPAFVTDLVNWVITARTIFTTDPTIAPYHLAIIVNHPVGSTSNPEDIALAQNVDMEMPEAGFSDFGNYQAPGAAGVFSATVSWMRWLQARNVAIGIIDKFDQVTAVTPTQEEYSIATYLMGKEQGAYLYTGGANGVGYGYGAEQWHPEYADAIGTACAEMYGGPSYDPKNPQIWYRRFSGGIAVVNSGSLPVTSENATLPSGRIYADIEGRPIGNPLAVASNDAYVLLTGGNSGCV